MLCAYDGHFPFTDGSHEHLKQTIWQCWFKRRPSAKLYYCRRLGRSCSIRNFIIVVYKVFYEALNRLLLSRLDEVLPLADFIQQINEMDPFSKYGIIKIKDSAEFTHAYNRYVFPSLFTYLWSFTFVSLLSWPTVERTKKSLLFREKVLLLLCG